MLRAMDTAKSIRIRSVLLLLWFAAGTAAAGLRCDTTLIARGMTPPEVVERCGDPEYESAFVEVRQPGVWVYVDEWLYNLGSNRFRRLLTFENGRLVRIETRAKPRTQPTATRALRNSLSHGPSSPQDGSRHGF